MFNMYDDVGIKTKITNPYEIKKLEAITPTFNKVTHNDSQPQNQQNFQMSQQAKEIYKQMAQIHVDEEILHTYQLMSHKVVTIHNFDTIYECWQKMEENDLKQIPVVDLNEKLVGLATMKNILKSMIENKENTQYINITTIGTISDSNIITAEPISDIRRVAKVMVKYHLNNIPIVDAQTDKIVGILSRADILRAVSTNPHFQLWA